MMSVAEYQNTENDVQFGSMRLCQKAMSILLVFAKEDAQSDGFWWAADQMGYKCSIARNPESALECYLDKCQDVVIIDNRNSKNFDAEALCRSIRATKASDHSVLVCVNKKISHDKEEPSILPLLTAGFNRRFIENHQHGACKNELLCLEYCEVRSQLKLRACHALFQALDNVSDAIEITNEDQEIQYVNHTYERLTGYSSEEVLGKDAKEFRKNDRNKPDIHETITSQLKKGKLWEGTFYTRRKSGNVIPHHSKISPVLGPSGKPLNYVCIKSMSSFDSTSTLIEKFKDSDYLIANGVVVKKSLDSPSSSTSILSLYTGGIQHISRRKDSSIARIHSMTIEAPITKVINIINAAQENSPLTVVQALNKVLEILKTSELYSPYLAQQMRDEDPMTSDLVGGLVSQDVRKSRSGSQDLQSSNFRSHHSHLHIPSTPTTLNQIPDNIQNVLAKEPHWDFDIIELENLTQKRPLLYLGLKLFSRFDVGAFLNIDESCMTNWLQLIEANYHSQNSYHNSTHAADVLHATAYFLERERVKNCFDQMDEVACLIAAIIHDVDHPGKTNAFLVNAQSHLAILYNDLTVLESHHAALAFQLTTRDDKVNIFKSMKRDDYKDLRQLIIDMVLATEMKQHFEHLNKFVNSVNKTALHLGDDNSSVTSCTSPDSLLVNAQLATPENRLLIRRMLIKCADVSNPVRPIDLCKEWAKRIADEYCQQTDEEKERGLPVVMPIFDRKTISIPKSQTSFIDVFINVMFDSWDEFCDVPELITHLQDNYQYWKDQEEQTPREKERAESVSVSDKIDVTTNVDTVSEKT